MSRPSLAAGAGRARIHIPDHVWPIDGFDGEHDPLWVRTLILSTGDDAVVLSVLDQTALPPMTLQAVRNELSRVTGVPQERILVVASHTFSAPHVNGAPVGSGSAGSAMAVVRESMLRAVADSARAARETMVDARLSVIAGVCDVNVNRDVETAEGWTLGRNEAGFSDKTLTVVNVVGTDGRLIAVLVNYAVQSSVMDGSRDGSGRRLATGDLCGVAMASIERAVPGATAMFLIGAAGDQAPALKAVRTSVVGEEGTVDAGDEGWPVMELLGERLATSVLAGGVTSSDLAPKAVTAFCSEITVAGARPVDRLSFAPTRSHVYMPGAPQPLPYWIVTLDSLAIVGVQVELSAEAGARLRAESPFPHTLVVTMVNGGAKYLPPSDAFDRMTYEALSSRYAKGAAERLHDAILTDLCQLARTTEVP